MKISFLVLLCKFVTKVCKFFRKTASVYPGYIIYDWFDKKVLPRVTYPKYVIAVTGSSGKGTTTKTIAHILKNAGYDVCYNENGSNGVLAATTLILNNCNVKGIFQREILLLECDERHLKLIFSKNKMTHLVITNVTRDQPARNGHPDIVFQDIMDAIGKDTHIIINADDPLVNRLSYTHKGPITKYGLEKTKDSYKTSSSVIDYAYCPICHQKLEYSFYHYGHIGSYTCPNHDFERGKLDYTGTAIDLDAKTMKINGTEVSLNQNVLYAAYSTIAAYSLSRAIGISEEHILYALNEKPEEAKRGHTYKIANREMIMLESKNENNLSYYQSIKTIVADKKKKTVILGFDNVSRRYKFNDLSWLWDVEFELLNQRSIDKIFIIGRFRYDVATRLAYASIPENKIILVDDVQDILNIIKEKSSGTIYTMVCFDMTAKLKELMAGEKE